MSWDCPYQVVDYCKQLKIKCNPLCKGCEIDPVTGIFSNGIEMIDEEHKLRKVIAMTKLYAKGMLEISKMGCVAISLENEV